MMRPTLAMAFSLLSIAAHAQGCIGTTPTTAGSTFVPSGGSDPTSLATNTTPTVTLDTTVPTPPIPPAGGDPTTLPTPPLSPLETWQAGSTPAGWNLNASPTPAPSLTDVPNIAPGVPAPPGAYDNVVDPPLNAPPVETYDLPAVVQ